MSEPCLLTISATRSEANDALYVEFDLPDTLRDAFRFRHGQYLTLCAGIDGQSVRRCYSICSPAGGPLAVAIKRIEGGVFSNHAHREFHPGRQVAVLPPAGDFTSDLDPAARRQYLCIAAGSGITPIISILETILAVEPESHVTLLYGNRRSADIMFRERLCWLKNAYLARLQWINVFSREAQISELLEGHIDNRKGAALNRRLISIRDYDEFFLCGPEAMISEVSRGLRGEGIDESRIHYELFFASPEDARAAIARHHARARRYAGLNTEVRVRAGGREVSFDLAADGENILDGAIRAGLTLPYSCKAGVCATCKARLVEGEVEMDVSRALTREQLDAGMILTCQSHPVSDHLVVDFDAL